MKKLLLAALTVLFSASVSMADTVSFDFNANQYGQTVQSGTSQTYFDDGTVLTENPVSLTFNKNGGNGARLWQASPLQLRVMNKCIMTVSINGGAISNIEFTAANTAMDKFTATPGTYTYATDKKSATWAGEASSVALTASATIQLTKIVVTYTGGVEDTRKDAGLLFSAANVTLELGDKFTAPTLTKITTAPVAYTSDNTSVATVDASSGAVTILAVGTARITAKAEANDEYKAGTASYLITVKEKINVPEGSVFKSLLGEGFSFANPDGLEVWKLDKTYGLKGTAFISSKTNAADAVAYTTEALDLTSKKNVKLTFSQALNNYKLNNVMISPSDFSGYAYVVAREEGATEWVNVCEVTAPGSFSWTFYDNAPVSLEAYVGKKVQVGFRYVSTAEVAGTWEVKNIFVTAENSANVSEVIVENEAPIEYFNLQGIRVANPEHGIFIRRQGNKVSKVVK